MPAAWAPRLLSLLRIVTGLIFLEHGTQKLLGFPPMAQGCRKPAAVQPCSGPFAGILELVGGFLLLIGLFTRPVAFLLSGEMAVAYWMFHATKGFFPALNRGDAAILYLLRLPLHRRRRARAVERRRLSRPGPALGGRLGTQ